MAKRDKRSRALLRNLRKQARKGTLSAREQDTLLNQEKKFRKARRRRRRGIGAGLGAALGAGVGAYLASPAFASLLQSGADAAALRRELKRQGASEEEAAKVEKAVESAPEGASAEEIVSDAAENLALELDDRAEILDDKGIRGEVAGDEELIRDLESIEEEEEAGIDDDLAGSMMAPSIFDNPNSLRSDAETGELLGARPEATRFDDPLAMGATGPRRDVTPLSVIVPPENQGSQRDLLEGAGRTNRTLDRGQLLELSEEERAALGPNTLTPEEFDEEVRKMEANKAQGREMRENTELTQQLRREGGYDPRTGEYVTSDRQQRIDDAFDEDFMREAFTDEERAAEAENARLDALDRARDAAIRASTIYPGFDAPAPNDGAPVFGEMGVLGQRPRLAGPNNPLSRRVNVADPGLRLPIVDIQEDPEDFYDLQEAIELENYRRGTNSGQPRARRRRGGPRVQAMGGKNPKMADLMKKVKAKYGIR